MIDTLDGFRFLHDTYKQSIFRLLDIFPNEKEYFYDERVFLWVKMVMEHSADETIFLTAKAYGGNNMTGILRFPFPNNRIERGSSVVLMGAGIMGIHFFLQNIINGVCKIVLWVEGEKIDNFAVSPFSAMREVSFDYVVLAYVREDLLQKAKEFLDELGVPEKKRIYGGRTDAIT